MDGGSGGGYTFTFMRQDGNRTLTRKETQDSSGFLKGIYWIQEPNGIFRLISYEADADTRFQARVLTNRPGEVNVTFPELPFTVTPPTPVSLLPTMTTASPCLDPTDVPSPPSSGPLVSSSNQRSSNCSDTLEPLPLLMTTGTSDEAVTTTPPDSTLTTDVTTDLEFETFVPTTDEIPTTGSDESEATAYVTTSATASDPTTTGGGGTDEKEDGTTAIDDHTDRSKGANGNDSQRQPSRARSKEGDDDRQQETTTAVTTAITAMTTAMVGIEEVERETEHGVETTSLIPTSSSGEMEAEDLIATTTSPTRAGDQKEKNGTRETVPGVPDESRPPAPLPDMPDEVIGSSGEAGSGGDDDALRYFLEYRIPVMNGNGGSFYRKEGTDARGRLIGSYMFLVRDTEDIDHKRQQLTRRGNNMTPNAGLMQVLGQERN